MVKKQLVTLLAVFGALICIFAILKLVRSSSVKASMSGVGEKVLPEFPINEVAKINIVGSEGSLTVSKKVDGGKWTVAERDDYPADFSKVSGLLREVWELKFAQSVEAGPSQFGRLGLLDPGADEEDADKTATSIQFLKAEGEVAGSLMVGKELTEETKGPFGANSETKGRYLKVGESDDIWLVAEPLSNVNTDPAEWISKDFFSIFALKSLERISRSKQDDWKIVRKSESDEWVLLGLKENEALDDSKIGSLKNAFSNPRFDDVVADMDSLEEGALELVATTFEGFTYRIGVSKELEDRKYHITVKVGAKFPKSRKPVEGEGEEGEESEEDKKAEDEMFAKEQEVLKEKLKKEKAFEGRVYLVPNFVVSPLLKRRLEITKNPNEAPKPEGPAGGTPGLGTLPGAFPPGLGGKGAVPGLPAGEQLPPELLQQLRSMNKAGGPGATAVTEPVEVQIPEGGKGKEKGGK